MRPTVTSSVAVSVTVRVPMGVPAAEVERPIVIWQLPCGASVWPLQPSPVMLKAPPLRAVKSAAVGPLPTLFTVMTPRSTGRP